MNLETLHDPRVRNYTGIELRPHYLLETFGLKGSALVSFVGACQVSTAHLVDWEDRLNQDFIRAKSMLHFVGEFFDLSLREGVFFQRYWVQKLALLLSERGTFQVSARGDDLFVGDRKLSVSIVTRSPVSTLLHFGINIEADGAPVPAVGLSELGLSPETVAEAAHEWVRSEFQAIAWACTKVRPVV